MSIAVFLSVECTATALHIERYFECTSIHIQTKNYPKPNNFPLPFRLLIDLHALKEMNECMNGMCGNSNVSGVIR